MSILTKHTGLYTDLYQLTMAQGYFLDGKAEASSCFDYFFRTHPFWGGYVVFAGLDNMLEMLEDYSFDEKDLTYLASLGFHSKFLDYLKDFRLKVNIFSPKEGEVVFAHEPVMRIEGPILHAQLIETLILNIINFQSLIATKASRIRRSAGNRSIAEFGLRRAQGLGGIHASRASIIGGIDMTSNVFAAHSFGLNAVGTQGHSWIQSYDDELTAFRKYAQYYPQRCTLLVDTYDTLKSGVPNAITVAKEMKAAGQELYGIRLDSGDLAYLSKKARRLLDEAGMSHVKIVASNQLDEYVIKSLVDQGAAIDAFGVGTALVTGQKDAALDGVYKMTMCNEKPNLKISENSEKMTFTGIKKVLRVFDQDGMFYADAIVNKDETDIDVLHHPSRETTSVNVTGYRKEELFRQVMADGKSVVEKQSVAEIARYAKERMALLPEEHKRFEYPHIYKVGVSQQLKQLQRDSINRIHIPK